MRVWALFFLLLPLASALLPVSLQALPPLLADSCAILAVRPLSPLLAQFLNDSLPLFREIQLPVLGLDASELTPSGNVNFQLRFKLTPSGGALLVLDKRLPDRSCLLTSHLTHVSLTGEVYDKAIPDTASLLHLVNSRCFTFWDEDGRIGTQGIHRQSILDQLYSLEQDPATVTLGRLFDSCAVNGSLAGFFYSGKCGEGHCSKEGTCDTLELPRCPVLDRLPAWDEFFRDYLSQSRPFIVRGAVRAWTAFSKWTPDFLRRRFGDTRVHVKLTPPKGEFEGVEPLAEWKTNETIPSEVMSQLVASDLVTVRPHGVDMNFSSFLDIIEDPFSHNFSAYLEYSSIKDYMKGLEEDISEWSWVAGKLGLAHTQVWISDGRTLGKLHFDQYDNFLAQIRGRKQVIAIEPWRNGRLGEGHIAEAGLRYAQGAFHRDRLLHSTSLTMAPLDITRPDFKRLPSARLIRPVNCTIDEGDVLFLPSFWWHEVQSYPSPLEQRNLAVNHWYSPFLTKEFPCPDCPMDVNSIYRHFL